MTGTKFSAFAILFSLILGIGGAFASHTDVSESDLVVSDAFDMSYSVAATEDVLSFLDAQGIDVNSANVSRAISDLRFVEYDHDDDYTANDSWETAKDELNYLVNSDLFAAKREGNDPVYMQIGTTRWVLHSSVE